MAFDDKQRILREPYPPLGTLIAAACARREGHTVALFDAMIASSTHDFEIRLNADQFDAVVFFEDNFNWLSKMCLNRMRQSCVEMIGMAKEKGALVVVAGSDPSDFPQTFLAAGADYVICGEAEFRLMELLAHYNAGATAPFCGPGVARWVDGALAAIPATRGERNLASFPQAAWDLVNMGAYRAIWEKDHGYFSLNMMTTRGCPYGCNWCAKPIHGRRYDVRDPLDCAREMARLKQEFQPDHIWFSDDIFGLKPGWVETFAQEVARLDGSLPFKIQVRADLITAETAANLKTAGCRTAWMGVESGSQKVLDAMDKDLDRIAVNHATRHLQEAGIEVCFFLQFGYPGEEAVDIRATWEMVAELKPHQIGISVAYPLPGTKFYEKVKDSLGSSDHWEHSHTMRPLHQTPYPADFYPVLYDYLHHRFRRLKNRNRRGPRGLIDFYRSWRTTRRLATFGVEGVPFK